MAVAILMEFIGGRGAQYDRVMSRLDLTRPENWPRELLLHVDGPNGVAWEVLEVWVSRKDFNRFMDQKLAPELQEAGLRDPRLLEFAVHSFMDGHKDLK